MKKARHAHIVLLLADGFEEAFIMIILTTLRDAGLRVTIVGLRSRQIIGAHGVVIKPDLSLDRVLEVNLSIMSLILPDGGGHIERLRSDPRVNILLQERLDGEVSVIGLGSRACKFLQEYVDDTIRCVSLYNGETCSDDLARQITSQLLEFGGM